MVSRSTHGFAENLQRKRTISRSSRSIAVLVLLFKRTHYSYPVTYCQDFLLSFVNHVRYTYAHTALPIPTLSSAHRIGLGRAGDDL
jgi:hypothetical protein